LVSAGHLGWRWFEPRYLGRVQWEFFNPIPRNWLERRVRRLNPALTRSCWQAVRAARRGGAKLLISHGPSATVRSAAFAWLMGSSFRHIAWSFNFSRLPSRLIRWLMARAFTQVDRMIVFSAMEQALYSEVFGIPAEKIEVVFWGAGEPPVAQPEAPIEAGDYICALGGNARDYPLLMKAMAQLPGIPLVAIMRPHNLTGLTIPPNVRVRLEIPLGEAHNILKYSRFMVLPLKGLEIPCGHITMVSAMRLRKAFIVTDSRGVRDYAQANINCLTCEANSVTSLAGRIRELWENPERCRELGEAGRRFAETYCSEESAFEHLDRLLRVYGVLA
jgi:glycosyltransferase involved in cell wall biosynthesis